MYGSSSKPPVSFFLFQNSHFHLSITFISIALFTYFIFSTCNFILQVFEDLDRMIRNSLNISGKQKMSKKEQNRKIAAVRKQISDLKSRVTKLQSCLHTLWEDLDQYFQTLNTDNREYVDWKKDKINQKRMRKITLPMKRKKSVMRLLQVLVRQILLDFFQ